MSSFKIKTHQPGRTYPNPHFFILNKGLNSGKPLKAPCPNCFVIITANDEDKNRLYHLTMMLQLGQYFAYYLKGSVIPFITINDCLKTIKNGGDIDNLVLQKQLKTLQAINQKIEAYHVLLNKIEQLKRDYIRQVFNNK